MPLARDYAPTLTGLHVLVTGNVVEGFTFYGPYKTRMDALVAGDRRSDALGDDSWTAAPLAAIDET